MSEIYLLYFTGVVSGVNYFNEQTDCQGYTNCNKQAECQGYSKKVGYLFTPVIWRDFVIYRPKEIKQP